MILETSDKTLRDALDAVLVGRAPSVTEVEPVGCTIKWRKG